MDDSENIVLLERVRCLECGATYVKPTDGGTVHRNPGCPRCGYVGWILATIPPRPGRRRSAEDQPRHRAVR